jgi:phosphatidylglycerophosphate synthase
MTGEFEGNDLAERVRLIESMIAEGRRSTGRWGWTFVLWGVAYYVATAWAMWGRSWLAWPVTMVAAAVLSSVLASRMRRGRPRTMLGRAVGAPWIAMGVAIMIVLIALAVSGRHDAQVYVAIIGAMLGTAHMTSAIILKWNMQFMCALVWLAAGVVACFSSAAVAGIAFLAATFLGQIVFGIYARVLESRGAGRGEKTQYA